MTYIFQDTSKALTRTVRAESSDIPSGKFVTAGTAEDQVVLSSAADDYISGVSISAAKEDRDLTIAENNAYVEVVASEAVVNNVRVYLSSDGQRLTDVKPTVAGTYISPGVSRTAASGANKIFVISLDPQEIIVEA